MQVLWTTMPKDLKSQSILHLSQMTFKVSFAQSPPAVSYLPLFPAPPTPQSSVLQSYHNRVQSPNLVCEDLSLMTVKEKEDRVG